MILNMGGQTTGSDRVQLNTEEFTSIFNDSSKAVFGALLLGISIPILAKLSLSDTSSLYTPLVTLVTVVGGILVKNSTYKAFETLNSARNNNR